MKKIVAYVMALIMVTGLSGCVEKNNTVYDSGKINIVATTFPEYDWACNIVGEAEGIDVTLLNDSAVDMHSYQPTVDDIAIISNCDLFIYVGGQSDLWANDILGTDKSKNVKAICMMDTLGSGVKEEIIVEGMQEDHDHEEDHEHEDKELDHGHDDVELDEHVWLSLKNAKILCQSITTAISEIDPDNADIYQSNFDVYIAEIDKLDSEYQAVVDGAPNKILLFGDRFPFRYMLDDYGIEYFAAFPGCSAETEASFETVAFLSSKISELDLQNVITIEGSNQSIAKTIIDSSKKADVNVITLNSIQSISPSEISSGTTYLSLMQDNLEVLKKALS